MHVFVRPTQRFLGCHVCGGLICARREVTMTTTGMTFFDLDSTGSTGPPRVSSACCGFVHTFTGGVR